MRAFSHSQYDSLNRAILHLYEPFAFRDFPGRVFEAARMIFPYEASAVNVVNLANKAFDVVLNVPAYDAFARWIKHIDETCKLPGYADGRLFAPGAPASLLDFMSEDMFRASPIHGFCRDIDVFHHVGINYHFLPDGTTCHLDLTRKRKPFDAAERRLLHFLQPHLSQRYRQLLAAEPDHPQAVLRERNWMICDGEGKIRVRSPRVSELFRQFGLASGPCLPAEWMAWFRGELRPAGAGAIPRPLVVERRRLRIVVHCLPNRISGEHRLVFENTTLAPNALSRREREIARWLAAGKTNAEIGEILGISLFTVKRHVQSILDKLGVENRTAAAATLLATEEFFTKGNES